MNSTYHYVALYLTISSSFYLPVCQLDPPPATVGQGEPDPPPVGYREYDEVFYHCPENMATILGEVKAVLRCEPDNNNWKVVSPVPDETIEQITERFNCTDCESEPFLSHSDILLKFRRPFREVYTSCHVLFLGSRF